MVDRSPKVIASALLVAALVLASGCLTTIDEVCSSAASTHCANCFSCAAQVDGVSGAELCDLTESDVSSASGCEAILDPQCQRQARVLQDPFDELEECEGAVETESCDDLVEREALDRPSAPRQCGRFL